MTKKMSNSSGNMNNYLSFFIQGLIGSAILTLIFESLARSFLVDFFRTEVAGFILLVIVAPIVEEYFKIYPLLRRKNENKASIIIYGFFIGLGFGLSEFFIYVFVANVPFLIRLPGLFFHAASASIAANGIVRGDLMKYYLIAVFLHAMVNFFAELGEVWILGGLGSVIITYILAYYYYKQYTG